MGNKRTMRELPESERPYEKCRASGPTVLSDAELLAVILRCGIPGCTSLELSIRILELLQDRGGLAALGSATMAELCQIPGIGRVKAAELQCIGELSRRISRAKIRADICLNSPASVAGYFMEDMRHLEQEEVRAAFFDTKGGLITSEQISRGTVNASLASPREIFLAAFRHHAVCVVLLHNHPSGDPSPSREDFLLTERLREAGALMSIPLSDHIVIGDNCYVSFREGGYIT